MPDRRATTIALKTLAAASPILVFLAIASALAYGLSVQLKTQLDDNHAASVHTHAIGQQLADVVIELSPDPAPQAARHWQVACHAPPFAKAIEDREETATQVCTIAVLTGTRYLQANYIVEMDTPGRNYINNLLMKEGYPVKTPTRTPPA